MIIYVCGQFSFDCQIYTSIVSQISSWLWTVLQIVLSYLIQTFKKPILLLLLFLFLCVFSCNLVDAMHKCNTVYYQFLYCRRDSKTISLESEEVKEHKKDNNFFPLAENYASQLESQNVSILELCIFPFMYGQQSFGKWPFFGLLLHIDLGRKKMKQA